MLILHSMDERFVETKNDKRKEEKRKEGEGEPETVNKLSWELGA